MRFRINNFLISLLLGAIFFSCSSASFSDSGLSRYEIKNLLRHKISFLESIASMPEIVNAVVQKNHLQMPIDTILQIDRQWSEYTIDHPHKKQMYNNTAGQILKKHVEDVNSYFSEIFITDRQGANVAAWPITSDYWQGDEVKWHRSFNNGNGKIYIGDIDFDVSSQSSVIQVSVPVYQEGITIGVLIGAIKLSELQAKYLRTLIK